MNVRSPASGTSSADPHGLAPLWDALMEIYDAFAALAMKHKWRWYVAYGNALGAIRHNGDFVPWDDDLDLVMPRNDYERFRKVANSELPACYRWVDYRNTASYPYLFGKIMDIRREVHDHVQRETGQVLPQGLHIDIWPLDGFPTTFFRKAWRWLQRQSLRFAMEYRTADYQTRRTHCLSHPIHWLCACLRPGLRTPRDFLRAMDAHARSYSMDGAELCGRPVHRWYELEFIRPVGVFGEPKMARFHGRIVPLPGDIERYLRLEYGDWEKLPPVAERRPTHGNSFEAPWKFGSDVPMGGSDKSI